VNTVRTHIRHLFAKLGAHRRTEAVARACALGLLAPSPHIGRDQADAAAGLCDVASWSP
jgi:Bacterial regulatory proteins, luxR family